MIKTADEDVVIIGGGLTGALLSIFLAKQGYPVELREKRADSRIKGAERGRSINLALSVRGIHALAEVSLAEAVLKESVPMRGRMIHGRSGDLTFQPYGKDETEAIHSVSRARLNEILLNAAEATGKVKCFFESKLISADLSTETLLFQNEKTGEIHTRNPTRVIGSDGSASVLRQKMAETSGFFLNEEHENYGYKELSVPPGTGGTFQMEKNALHIWPRGNFMLIALPNTDGSFTCTLFLPYQGEKSFASIQTENEILKFFEEEFPDTINLIPSLVSEFKNNPTGHLLTIRCSPWHFGEKFLLMGDAAHAIVPFFGQGMNCAFEGCGIFSRMLREHSGNWGETLSRFSKQRKPDADAIADMALENFIEMRDKVSDASFLLRKKIEQLVAGMYPERFQSRYSLVTFSQTPYAHAQQQGRAQDAILDELCKDIAQADELDWKRAEHLLAQRDPKVVSPSSRE